MNPIQRLEQNLRARFPGLDALAVTVPANPQGHWWLDLAQGDHEVTVEWGPTEGFGISAAPFAGYGEGHDEVFTDFETMQTRVFDLVENRGRTRPPREVLLRNLREEMAELTQQQLADRLGVNQPAVAKMERRQDMTISTLRRTIEAMGGRLDLIARFPDEELRITQFDPAAPKKAAG